MSEGIIGSRSAADGTGFRLDPYLATIRLYRWLILGLALAGAVAGLVLALSRPPVFEARATVFVNRPTATPAAPSQATRAFFSNQGVAAQMLSETGLDRPPFNIGAAAFLRDDLSLDDVVPGSMLQVRVRLPDQALATRACSRLVALAIELNGRVSAEESLAGQEFVKQQLDSSRQRLDELQSRLLAFKGEAQVDVRRGHVEALLEGRRALIDLEMRLAAERGRLAAAESELARRSGERRIRPSDSQPSGPTGDIAPNASGRGGAVVSDRVLREQRRRQSETHAESAADETSIAEEPLAADRLEGLIDGLYEALDYEAASSRVRLAGLESQRKELIGRLGLTRPSLKQLTELYKREIEEARLQADYDASATVYQELLKKYEEVRIQVGSSSSGMKLLDPAVTATNVSRPLASVAASLGGVAGLGGGILFAFALEFFRASRPVHASTASSQ